MVKYRDALVRYFCIILVVVMIALTALDFGSSLRTITTQIAEARANELTLINQRIAQINESACVVLNVFSGDNYTYKLMMKDDLSGFDITEAKTHIYIEKLSAAVMLENLKIPFYITVVCDNGFSFTSQKYSSEYDFDKLYESQWFQECKNSGKEHGYQTRVNDNVGKNDEQYVFVAYDNYYSYLDNSYLGTVMVCVDEVAFKESYEPIIDAENNIYLFDDSNRLFGKNEYEDGESVEDYVENFLNSDSSYKIYPKNNSILIKNTSSNTGWTVFEEISMSSVFKEFKPLATSIIIITIVAMLAIILH